MGKHITLRLSGLAKAFVDEMKKNGLTEEDVIS